MEVAVEGRAGVSYLEDDPPVPKLLSTVPINNRTIYPRVASIDESSWTIRIDAGLGEMRLVCHVPRSQWQHEMERMNGYSHPWSVAQWFVNNAFDRALGR